MSIVQAPAAATAARSVVESVSVVSGSLVYAAPPEAVPVAAPTAVRMLNSDDIFGDSREVCIAHRGALYRLRITMQNRLILQK